jgi:hypothetical protein
MVVIRPQLRDCVYSQFAPRFRQAVFDKMVQHCLGKPIPISSGNLVDMYTSIVSVGRELIEPNSSLISQLRNRSKEFALSCWYEVLLNLYIA